MTITSENIIAFWFRETDSKMWFRKDGHFDAQLKEKFSVLHQSAAACELWAWRATPLGRLAEIIVLDQFSRNIFRDTKESFAQDSLALVLAQEAVSLGIDKSLATQEKSCLYLPFMHSESALIHAEAVKLFSVPGLEGGLAFELRHKTIIDRFGRYPHRNTILGRASTAEELKFLKEAGSSF